MNEKLFQELLTIVSPTLDYRFGAIQKLPFLDVDCEDLYIDGYQVKLVSDTSYGSLWEVSFTLKEF